jgi:hypothetical protein
VSPSVSRSSSCPLLSIATAVHERHRAQVYLAVHDVSSSTGARGEFLCWARSTRGAGRCSSAATPRSGRVQPHRWSEDGSCAVRGKPRCQPEDEPCVIAAAAVDRGSGSSTAINRGKLERGHGGSWVAPPTGSRRHRPWLDAELWRVAATLAGSGAGSMLPKQESFPLSSTMTFNSCEPRPSVTVSMMWRTSACSGIGSTLPKLPPSRRSEMGGAPETPTWQSRGGVKVRDGRRCHVPHTLTRNMFDEMATTMCGGNVTKFKV